MTDTCRGKWDFSMIGVEDFLLWELFVLHWEYHLQKIETENSWIIETRFPEFSLWLSVTSHHARNYSRACAHFIHVDLERALTKVSRFVVSVNEKMHSGSSAFDQSYGICVGNILSAGAIYLEDLVTYLQKWVEETKTENSTLNGRVVSLSDKCALKFVIVQSEKTLPWACHLFVLRHHRPCAIQISVGPALSLLWY